MDRRTFLVTLGGVPTLGLAGCLEHEGGGDDSDPLETPAAELRLTLEDANTLEDRWTVRDESVEEGEGRSIELKPEGGYDPILEIAETASLERATRTFEDETTGERLISGVAVYESVDDASAEWNDSVRDVAASFASGEVALGSEGYGLESAEPFILFRDAEAVGFCRHLDPVAVEEAEDDSEHDDGEEPDDVLGFGEGDDEPAGGDVDLALEYAEVKHDAWR